MAMLITRFFQVLNQDVQVRKTEVKPKPRPLAIPGTMYGSASPEVQSSAETANRTEAAQPADSTPVVNGKIFRK